MRVAFHTLGCKVNSYETQAITEQFISAGWDIAEFTQPADVYIVNTCSVTQMAEHKSRQLIHRARKLNPEAIVVATGCYAQRSEADLKRDSGVDLIIGNNNKSLIVDAVENMLRSERQALDSGMNDRLHTEQAEGLDKVDDLMQCRDYEAQMISDFGENVRAYVKIQDGCNRFCSYCIIPYVRGRSRCRPEEDIISEIRALAANAYKEIVLTGIDISMYENMGSLIEEAARVPGIERIRLGSLEAGVITEEFIEQAAGCGKFCPQFHLSLQSGCASTLRRMNRHYTPEEFARKAELIRKYFDSCAITTDVIVGFPGESDEEFEESLSFVKSIGFARTHVFKYSRRAGTAADRMKDQIPENIKNERSAVMIAAADEMAQTFAENLIGQVRPVLIEEKTETGMLTGFTPEYIRACVTGSESLINSIVNIKFTGFAGEYLEGRITCSSQE